MDKLYICIGHWRYSNGAELLGVFDDKTKAEKFQIKFNHPDWFKYLTLHDEYETEYCVIHTFDFKWLNKVRGL